MKKIILFPIVFVLVLFGANSFWADQVICSTTIALTSRGWVIHSSSDFMPISQQVLAKYLERKTDYVYDTGGFIYSFEVARIIKFESYDRLATPHDEMYGDIVLITVPESGELIELRWYDGQTKHVVFDDEYQCCVTNLIPLVENSLF